MSRADLLALTPASVAALANLGLVKRAQREIEAGKGPALDEEPDGTVSGRFDDGVQTRLPPGVPLRDASCTCGSTSVCRHRVAVALAYPAWFAGPGSRRATPTAPEEWSPSCFADPDLLAFTGKRVFARAQAAMKSGLVVELEGGPRASRSSSRPHEDVGPPLARLPTCTVVFHVPRDLAYARCDCQATIACEHVVLAAWAFRQAAAAGRPPPCTIDLGAASAVAEVRSDALGPALALAEHLLLEGVVRTGPADKPRFARVRAGLGEAGLLWPGAIVDDLEAVLDGYHGRSARYRTADAVFLLASLAARARSVRARDAALPARYLLGSDEARETPLDHVRLVSLGARIEANGDIREASVFLADPDSGVVLVVRRELAPVERAGKTVIEEGPDLARRTLVARVSFGALACGQLVTRAAKRHANHALTLGSSRTAQTSVAPSSGDWSSLPPSLLCSDLEALARDLASRPPRLLQPRTLAAQMRVVAIGAVLELAYRPGDQELVAILAPRDTTGADTHGRTIRLVRRHARTGPSALDALAKALAGAPRFVAGDVRLGPAGLELDPTAIVTDRVVVPDLEIEPRVVERLPLLAPARELPQLAAVGRAASVLEEALHDGLANLREGFFERALAATEALGAVGLLGAKERLARLCADAPRETLPRAWLDAAIRLELTREACAGATGAG